MSDYLRKAEIQDMELLFTWANDPACRKNAFHTEPIRLEEHKVWFQKKLQSPDSVVYIYMVEQKAVGQVRVDREGHVGVIDYFIREESRGQGYGVSMLKRLEEKMKQELIVNQLEAYVKSENIPSNRVFQGLAYDKEEKENMVIYKKNLV